MDASPRTIRTATVTHCVILAATPVPPPVIAAMMREWMRFGVEEFLLLGDTAANPADLPKRAQITILPAPGCECARLRQAAPRLHERFLLCDAARPADANFARLLADAAVDGPEVAARLLRLEATPPFTEENRHGYAELAAVAVLRRALLEDLPDSGGLFDALSRRTRAGSLRLSALAGWQPALGAQPAEAASWADAYLRRLSRPALFLDRDGVLNLDHGYVGTRDRWEWVPGAIEAIRAANDAGWHVFVATNQSGIARGHYDVAAFDTLMAWVVDTLRAHGATIDDLRSCPYHPEGSVAAYRRHSDWRKPEAGMLQDLARAWRLDPARCTMVGDQQTDLQAAATAGMAGVLFRGGDLRETVLPLLR